MNVKWVNIKRRWGLLFSLYPGTSRFNFHLPLFLRFQLQMVAETDILALTEGDSLIFVICMSGTCEWKMSLIELLYSV